MSPPLPDPRLNAYRADLAAEDLRGLVEAPRYAGGERRQVTAASAPLRREPRFDAALDTELLCGETLTVYEEREGWAWAQADRDRYVGYVPARALSREVAPLTHRVAALRTYLYPAPDIKAPPLDLLSLNAGVSVAAQEGGFLKLRSGSFLFAAHAAPVAEPAEDFVAVAERFLGTPYLWGGRTSLGLDCSALVQLSLQAAGVEAPRDTDMQEAALGVVLGTEPRPGALRRGDLVFWKGHVGVMLDGERLLHATAHVMETVIEPVGQAVARIAGQGQPVSSVRRCGTGRDG